MKIDKKKLKRKLSPSQNPFLSLTRSIIYQQISTKAGNAINGRFLKLFKGELTPKKLLNISEKDLRQAGLSSQKISYLKDLAEKFLNGTIQPEKFPTMSDQEIKEHLVQVKGIGSWTADMFLIFALNRPNILPVGDLGIKKGFEKVFNLKTLPSERTMRRLAKEHAGSHTFLALYLWQAIDESDSSW